MSAWFEPLYNYCERTAIGLANEPLNAITNIAFFASAYLLLALYRREKLNDRPIALLIALIFIVGLGSLAFHTFATLAAMMADVFPIVIFVSYYIFVSFTRLLEWKTTQALTLVGGFIALGIYADGIVPPYNLNGSLPYIPCLVIIFYLWRKMRHTGAALLFRNAFLGFALSLAFRTFDMALCSTISSGTHFLWHVCNGIVLYLLVKALILARKPAN